MNKCKPNGYWNNKELCGVEALKYSSKNEFKVKSNGAYSAACKNGWLNEICSHMISRNKPKNYYTLEICAIEAKKYNSKKEFKQMNPSAYSAACKNGWLDVICSHMISFKKPKGYWTEEKCHKEALNYKTRTEFSIGSQAAYHAACKNGWLDVICSHMIDIHKPKGYWTKEKAHEIALKYKTKSEFRKFNNDAYDFAHRNGFVSEICSHMEIQGNEFYRFIYVFEFEDKSAYIGLTQGVKGREGQHLNDETSQVFKHIQKTNAKYVLKTINNVPSIKGDAQELEHKIKLEYIENGYNVLNTGATGRGVGSLGGSALKWTKEKLQEEALKYKTRTEFQKKANGAYCAAYKNKWLDEICTHMVNGRTLVARKWSKEKIREEALKYTTRSEFHKKSCSAYNVAYKNNWLDEFCTHMVDGRDLIIRKWSRETSRLEALKYKTKNEFKKHSVGAYNACRANNWLDEFCAHMETFSKPRGHWKSKENCRLEALKYEKRTHFKKYSKGAFNVSKENDWLDEFFPLTFRKPI